MKSTTTFISLFLTLFVAGCDLGDYIDDVPEDIVDTVFELDSDFSVSPAKAGKGNNGKSDEAPGHNKECTPGETQQCWCPGDGHYPTGAQHCHASGNRWDRCECQDPDEDPDTSAGCGECPTCGEEEEEEEELDSSSDTLEDEEEELDLLPEDEQPVDDGLSVEWVAFNGGQFVMGQEIASTNNAPAHSVAVHRFLLAKRETTVGAYGRCVIAGACSEPTTTVGNCRDQYGLNSWTRGIDRLPVNCVTWFQAREFCRWVGGRLPSEAEWEFAARSRGQDITYPWGSDEPQDGDAIFAMARPEVGCSAPGGITDQGLCDLAGNVFEMVEDEFYRDYTNRDGTSDPWTDPDQRLYRIRRGGNYQSPAAFLETRRRSSGADDSVSAGVGFRCAADVL